MKCIERITFLALATIVTACLSSNASPATGRTPGNFNVSDSGVAQYTFPIFLPRGAGGLTRQLALAYGHRGIDGHLGVGWALGGLSVLSRCNSTWTQNNVARNVRNDSLDRFCLDGNQLRLVFGTYGVAGSEYRTELETFSRVIASGTAGNGPASFTVERKDGSIYEYGNTTDSRIESVGQSSARVWLVNKIRDRSGNEALFNYAEDTVNGGYGISSIQYTRNMAAGVVTPPYTVTFYYQALPSGEVDSQYLAGSQIKRITRINRIDVTYNSAIVRRYELAYEGALSLTKKSRLASIQECAGSAGTDCYSSTTITYQNSTTGLNIETSSGITMSLATGPIAMDINGDGRKDLAYPSTSNIWTFAFASASGSYDAPVSTGIATASFSGAIPIDYNNDGREDLLGAGSGSTWWVMLGSATGLSAPTNTSTPTTTMGTGSNAAAADIDGDGRQDLVWLNQFVFSGGDTISYRLQLTTGGFSSTVQTLAGPSAVDTNYPDAFYAGPGQKGPRRMPDFDGDGRADIVWRKIVRRYVDPVGYKYTTTVHVQLSSGGLAGFITSLTASSPFFGDFNGDGRTDIIYDLGSGTARVRYSTGTGFTGEVSVPTSSTDYFVMDYDGDGFDDVLSRNNATASFDLTRSNGVSFDAVVSTGINNITNTLDLSVGDTNGDGMPDLAYRNSSGTWMFRLRSGNYPDLASTITDGFGNSVSFTYASIANYALYTRYTTAVFPQIDFGGPLLVVSNVSASNGVGLLYNLQNFTYAGARLDLQGRGLIGFAKMSWADSRNNIVQEKNFRQDFPYMGAVSNSKTKQPSGVVISEDQSTFANFSYGSGYEIRFLSYTSQLTHLDYEVGGTYNGNLIRTSSTTNSADLATGNIYDSVTTITEATTANGISPGQSFTQRTYTPVLNLFTDTANWCIGRPQQTQQINSHTMFGGAQLTRTVNTTWVGSFCRPTQTVSEPGNSTLQITTDVGYDSFGNVNSQTVTGKKPDGTNMTARTTLTNWGATGTMPVTVTNALNQSTTLGYNYLDGTRISATDPNSVNTTWQYDNFGRLTRETRSDGTATTTTYNDCASLGCVNANNKLIVIVSSLDTSSSVVTDSWTHLDKFDRPMISSSRLLSGSYDRREREYDALGRTYRERAPCLWSSCTTYWTTMSYDLANRVSQVARPISDTNPATQTSNIFYEGLTTRSVDANNKTTTQVVTVLNQPSRSKDNDNYFQQFDYDAFGNTVRVTDSASNTLQTSTFNISGATTAQTDMDMGSWTFVPNSLGETTSQTDAKGLSTAFTFDVLGRPLTRTEAEGTTTWTWGASAAAKNIGRLESVTGPGGIGESFLFDGIGRPIQASYNMGADGVFVVNSDYNSIGAPNTISYPTSTNNCRLSVQYGYQFGQLKTITNVSNAAQCGTSGQVYWNATGNNARNQLTQETLGNGLVTNRAFDAVTAWIKNIQTGIGGGTGVQNLAYQWDLVGNLSQRQDVNQSLTESFTYDNLYRLDVSQLNGLTNLDLSYDGLGNITSKSDVGSYTYNATKKHAVASTSNGWTFSYDANGNMQTGRGATYTWTSYNYVASITNGGINAQFSYGPNRNYWKQVATYSDGTSTTIYVGGLLEKVTSPGGVATYRHMVRAGGVTVIVSRDTAGTNNPYYMTQDHLGSSSAVTNSSGTVLMQSSFGSYGARRGSNWSGSPSTADMNTVAYTTRRGYTDHSMLDNLSLIHMNGRVQDPVLGRFVSSDPFIDGFMNTQGWNRYSYLKNSPLALTDMSGFGPRNGGGGRVMPNDGDDGYVDPGTEDSITQGSLRQSLRFDRSHGFDNIPPMQQVSMAERVNSMLFGFTGVGGSVNVSRFSSWTYVPSFGGNVTLTDGTIVNPDSFRPGQWVYSPGSSTSSWGGMFSSPQTGGSSIASSNSLSSTGSGSPPQSQQCARPADNRSFGDKAADFIVGFGDAFLIPIVVRKLLDIDGGYDPNSAAYSGGKIAGIIEGFLPMALEGAAAYSAAAAARGAPSVLNVNRFLRIGPGRMPANGPGLPAGTAVPRASFGSDGLHLDLRSRIPPIPPVGALVGGGGC